jgi:alkaline phosphatase D
MPELARRSFLAATAVTAASTVVGAGAGSPSAAAGPYFHHGLASGGPLPSRVLLWTRLTPTPHLVPGVGSGPTVSGRSLLTRVHDIARQRRLHRFGDERLHRQGRSGGVCRLNTAYYYRFLYSGVASPVGARERLLRLPLRRTISGSVPFGSVWCRARALRRAISRRTVPFIVTSDDYGCHQN